MGPGGAETRRGECPEGRLTTDPPRCELGADEGLEAEGAGSWTPDLFWRAARRTTARGQLASDEEAAAAQRRRAPERANVLDAAAG